MGLKEKIISLRKENRTYNEIAVALQCAKSTISYHCKKEGLDDLGNKLESLEPNVVVQIKKYLLKNTSVAAAKKFNISESTVKKYKKAKVYKRNGKLKVYKKTSEGTFVPAQYAGK